MTNLRAASIATNFIVTALATIWTEDIAWASERTVVVRVEAVFLTVRTGTTTQTAPENG